MATHAWITPSGATVGWTGESGAESSTCGMHVVLASRATTPEERATYRDLCDQIKAAPVNPPPGELSYGDAHRALDAWLQALPRRA